MQSRFGVREKLFLISVLLIAIVGVICLLFLQHQLRGWFTKRLQQELSQHAHATRLLLQETKALESSSTHSDTRTLSALFVKLGRQSKSRLTLIRHDGLVLSDSHLNAAQLTKLENHKDRPEIIKAMQGQRGVANRFSKTLQKDMLYVAIPFASQQGKHVVRVAMPLIEVEQAISRLRLLLLFAALLGLGVAIFMSGLASHLIGRALKRMVDHAQAIASGDSDQPLPDTSGDELGGLAGSLNRMADELKRTVASLANARNRLEAVLENINASVLACDNEQRITLANRATLDLFGTTEVPRYEKLDDIFDAPRLYEIATQASNGASIETEIKLGEQRFLIRATPLDGNRQECVIVMHDITELRRLETVRRDFVANVSHELRTPLSIIRANAETLLDGAIEQPKFARKFLHTLLRHTERLSNLVRDLLDISRIEANQFQVQAQRMHLRPTVQRMIDSVDSNARKKELIMHNELPEALKAYADPQALEQVLLNLLDNAVKYTPEHGDIVVSAHDHEDGQVRIEVCDNGPGIPEKHHSRIFERFYRIDPGRSRDMGGTGLGLSIAKNLTEAMGGSVGIKAAPTQGTIFWFSLPRKAPPPPPQAEEQPTTHSSSRLLPAS